MKVVLLKDVPSVGRKGEVKTVSDGHALNFLIPKKFAIVGTPAALAHAEQVKSAEEARRTVHEDLLFKNLALVHGLTMEMTGKANEQGHLFASIHPDAIAAELKKQKGIELLPEFVVLEKPIKELGEHVVTVKAHDKTGTLLLVVKSAAP